MVPLRDALGPEDLEHLRRILGHEKDQILEGTRRRVRVDHIATADTYLDDAALEAFKSLSQPDREQLLSDVIWQVTCHVEGSITRMPGVNALGLEFGFRLVQSEREGREVFCVVQKADAPPK